MHERVKTCLMGLERGALTHPGPFYHKKHSYFHDRFTKRYSLLASLNLFMMCFNTLSNKQINSRGRRMSKYSSLKEVQHAGTSRRLLAYRRDSLWPWTRQAEPRNSFQSSHKSSDAEVLRFSRFNLCFESRFIHLFRDRITPKEAFSPEFSRTTDSAHQKRSNPMWPFHPPAALLKWTQLTFS